MKINVHENAHLFRQSRREFMSEMTLLSTVMFTASALPFATSVFADTAVQEWSAQRASSSPFVDEALGNYPAYAEPIGYGRAHLLADNTHAMAETYFVV